MLRAEQITDLDKIRFEIDTHNAPMPNEGELSATMFIAMTDPTQVRSQLVRLIGIDQAVSLRVGRHYTVPAVFEAGRSKRDNLSAVQYVRFPLSPEVRAVFRDEQQEAVLAIHHPHYQARTALRPETRRALAAEV